MSNKRAYPSTRAVHFLDEHEIGFNPYSYRYVAGGNIAKDAAAALGVSELEIFKTLVFTSEAGPLLVLIDAAHRVGAAQTFKSRGRTRARPRVL
jgi:prolyl-tRNA editing enzyme YbaK/EbsC (Cys-tRNA(Pro) deacylase)